MQSLGSGEIMNMGWFKAHMRIGKKSEEGQWPIRIPMLPPMMILLLFILPFIFSAKIWAAEAEALRKSPLTEQEVATERFLSHLEATLAQKFFDIRTRPRIRVAIFDFTDEAGNTVKAGVEWAGKIGRRLYSQPQFDVVSHEKVNQYLGWSNLSSLGKVDARGLRQLQRRVNTMDPGSAIHALILGEVKKGAGRSLQMNVSLVNFESKIGQMELEKNILDVLPLSAEIPLPTEKALQEATEIVVPAGRQEQAEGQLLILANTRGHALIETQYLSRFNKDQPFPWDQVPFALVIGQEEGTNPEQVRIGLEKVPLAPIELPRSSVRRMEYSFLHGKFATNEVYFDEMLPSRNYHLTMSFMDAKTNQMYSEMAEVQVLSGATTLVVVSFYVPSERERLRSKQRPRINVFQVFGKQTDILPQR